MDDKSHATAIYRCKILFMPTSQIKHVCKRAPRLILSVPLQPKYYAYVLWCLDGICYRSILSWVSGLLQWHWENKTFICSKTSDIDTIDIRYHWTESYWWLNCLALKCDTIHRSVNQAQYLDNGCEWLSSLSLTEWIDIIIANNNQLLLVW